MPGGPGTGWPRPRILASRCLGFDHCRWNGEVVDSPFLKKLAEWADYVTVCPEVAIGLGVPRDPIRLTGTTGAPRLVQPSTGRDLTKAMEDFAGSFLDGLGDVDGAVLKFRSPSCGISDVKVHPSPGSPASIGKRAGLFGGAVLERLSGTPVIHEGRLLNMAMREHFFTAVFTLAKFRAAAQACTDTGRAGPLVDFHASAKLLLMGMNMQEERRLGRITAGAGTRIADSLAEYGEGLGRALSRPARSGPVTNVLLHAMGYFKDLLGPAEKALFLDCLEGYRSGRLPLSSCQSVLRAWNARFGVEWLSRQIFFEPFPPALAALEDSGRGRPPRGADRIEGSG
jgi:uncharacterized protein YbgA (DUF1722 family)/uncharacterized protein YbbK (DUF523 family)